MDLQCGFVPVSAYDIKEVKGDVVEVPPVHSYPLGYHGELGNWFPLT